MADHQDRGRGNVAAFSQLGRPRRSTEALESLVETLTAKVELLERALDRVDQNGATREHVQQVYLEIVRTRKLQQQSMKEAALDRASRNLRDEAVMTMLAEIVGRLPSPGSRSHHHEAEQLTPTSSEPSKKPSTPRE